MPEQLQVHVPGDRFCTISKKGVATVFTINEYGQPISDQVRIAEEEEKEAIDLV